MKKLRMENCELRIGSGRASSFACSRFTIHNSPFLSAPLLLLWTGSLALAASPTPTATPTPHPRLSGGFGRAAATPGAAEGNGQSFADVVRAASEAKARREQKANVAITNETLVTDRNKGKLTTAQPRNLPPPTPAKATEPDKAATPSSTAGSEADWRERARSARKRVEAGKARVYQLEGEAAALEKDFYRWDDGQYRDGVIKPAWDHKKEELAAARKELAEAEGDLADLPEKARKAGALPGWVRE